MSHLGHFTFKTSGSPGPAGEVQPLSSPLPSCSPSRLQSHPLGGPQRGPRSFPIGLTIALESLPRQAPQQGPTVLTEGRAFVIVDFESMWHVNFESLLVELKKGRTCDQTRVPAFQLWVSWQALESNRALKTLEQCALQGISVTCQPFWPWPKKAGSH